MAFGKSKENTVDKNCEYNEVIEDLVGGDEDGTSAERIPWGQTEERLGGTEPMDVLLLKAFCYNKERL